MPTVNESMNGSAIEIQLGGELDLSLSENSTTGYRWSMLDPGTPVLQLEQETREPPTTRPGAGTARRWRFRAVARGAADVRLRHGRSWGDDAKKDFVLSVSVT